VNSLRNRGNTENDMIETDVFPLPPEFPDGKDVAIEKFLELILKNAPKYDCFNIYEMNKTLPLNDIERKQFKYLFNDLRRILIKKRFVDFAKNSNLWIELTELGQNYFNEKTSEPIKFTQNIENYIGGDNNGNQLSRSNVKNIKIKSTIYPSPNENKQNPIISFVLKCWWQLLIPLFFVIVTAVFNSERIMNFINRIINKL
jgi:hypothetical protein